MTDDRFSESITISIWITFARHLKVMYVLKEKNLNTLFQIFLYLFFETKALNIPDVFNVIWAKKSTDFSHLLGTDCLLGTVSVDVKVTPNHFPYDWTAAMPPNIWCFLSLLNGNLPLDHWNFSMFKHAVRGVAFALIIGTETGRATHFSWQT